MTELAHVTYTYWTDVALSNRVLLKRADHAFQQVLRANSAEPYVHAEYERWLSIARAALTLATTNPAQAFALEECFHDSNETMEYYLRHWSLEELERDYSGGEPMRLKFEAVR